MAPFSISSGYRLLGIPNSCLNHPLLVCYGRGVEVQSKKLEPFILGNGGRSFSASCCLSSCSFVLKECCSTKRCSIRCCKMIVSRINCRRNEREFDGEAEKKADKRKKISLLVFLENVESYLRKNPKRVIIFAIVSIALAFCIVLLKLTAVPTPKVVCYSDFITSLQGGSVSNVLFEEGTRRIFYNTLSEDSDGSKMVLDSEVARGTINPALSGLNTRARSKTKPDWKYSTRKIEHDETFLFDLMREKGTTYSSAPQSVVRSLRNVLVTLLSLWIPLAPIFWLAHRQLSAGNNPAKKRRPANQIISFDDVEGVDAAKEELLEIVSCLQGSINYSKLGARLPKGVLLVGPPGTGKTLLARAVAGEAGVPFFSVSASEFVELFVGRGASRIRDLFSVARKHSPSIIFIDELDAVGGKRGRSFNDERDQTLNQLLTEMDGFESNTRVIVIAATNRPEALDPALCRPGRFSRRVFVGEPNFDGRKKILGVHIRGVPLEEDSEIICNLIATLTPGLVGADLANIVNEAALLAARRGGETVSRDDVMMAIERTKFGINERPLTPASISKGLEKLFPWMSSFSRRDDNGEDGWEGLKGYQTLS